MATKIYCDGCDRDITEGRSDARKGIRINATSQAGEGQAILGQFEVGPFDLCGTCIECFKRDCNPKNWARETKVNRVA